MLWFCFGKKITLREGLFIVKIELELNNLKSILSRSAVTPVFPACPFSFYTRIFIDLHWPRLTHLMTPDAFLMCAASASERVLAGPF